MKQTASAKIFAGYSDWISRNRFFNTILLNNENISNQCHEGHDHGHEHSEFEKAHAQEDYENLQKIFEDQHGMMDQHEMMEMMMKRSKDNLRPFPFEKVMANCGGFKQFEAVDGLKVNIMLPMGQLFQLGGEWTLSNSKGPSFEFTSVVCHQSGNNPNPMMMTQEQVQTAHFQFASDQTGRVAGSLNLPFGIACQTQTMFNDPACKEIMNMVQLQKDFRDSALSLRYQGMQGQGAYTATYMQSLNRNIQGGFQVHYQPQVCALSFGYCGYYKIGAGASPAHQFAAAYHPLQQRETMNFSYVGKPSQRLQLFSELKGNFFTKNGTSEFMAGARLRFDQGMITGYMNSAGKLFGSYTKTLDFGKLEFNSQLDLKGATNKCLFGMNLQIGMGM